MLHQIPNFYECDICRKNISSANHYCHDCQTIFCDECEIKEKEDILICSECGMNLLAADDKTGELYCKQCHDEGNVNSRLITITREKSVCPKCKSTNTSDIDEFKSKLKERYKDIILESRTILNDFQNFANYISIVKQKLLKLRLEPPVLSHDPNLEKEMLQVFNEVNVIEQRILKRLRNFFLFLDSKNIFFFSRKTWRSEDFSVLESYVAQLESDFTLFLGQISESFNQPLDILQSMKNKIEFLEKIKNIFRQYQSSGIINLERDEYPVYFIENVKIENDDNHAKIAGNVLITSKKFLVIKTQGFIKKINEMVFSLPIDKLLSFEIVGKVFKRLSLQFQGINLKLNVDKKGMNVLVLYLKKLSDFMVNNKIDLDNVMKIKEFDLNSIFKIKTFIENNINILIQEKEETANVIHQMAVPAIENPDNNPSQLMNDSLREQNLFHELAKNIHADNSLEFGVPLNDYPDDFAAIDTSVETHKRLERIKEQIDKFNQYHNRIMSNVNHRRMQVNAQIPFNRPGWQPNRNYNVNPSQNYRTRQQPVDFQDNLEPRRDQYQFKFERQDKWSTNSFQEPATTRSFDQDLTERRFIRRNQFKQLVTALQSYKTKIYAINETLSNLEQKFESGKVSANVYFQTHQLFKEKLLLLKQEMQEIRRELSRFDNSSRDLY
ncbi:MAG: hypothetical protein ACTSXU_06695 [Promethearchaeota archaeon]